MISTGIGLLLLSLVSGDALIICGGDLAHINTETGLITPSVGVLHTYPNDVIINQGFAFVVNSGADQGTLQRFDLETWALTELGIGTGWNCWASLALPDGKLAVSATLNNSICMVDPASMQILSDIDGVGPNPEWMAVEGNLLYAACGGWGTDQSIVVVNTETGSPFDTLTAGLNCQSVISDGNGKLFVTCSGTYGSDNGSVVVLSAETGTMLASLQVGGFPAFSAAAGGKLYTADPWGAGVFSVDMETLTVLHDKNNPFCPGGNGMATDENGFLWISDAVNGEVRVYDTEETLVHTYTVANPGPIAVSGAYMGISTETRTTPVNISVFPNPAMNAITVTGAQTGTTVRIFDIAGRITAESSAGTDGVTVMDITVLKPGLYTAVAGNAAARFAVTAR